MKNSTALFILIPVIILSSFASALLESTKTNPKQPSINIDNARAELELAKANKNLDSLYLSLKKLESLGQATKDELKILEQISGEFKVRTELAKSAIQSQDEFNKESIKLAQLSSEKSTKIEEKLELLANELRTLGSTEIAVAATRAKLDVSVIKHDFENMFLSIRALDSLKAAGDEDLLMLAKATKALDLESKLLQAQADHDHEVVVHSADNLLKIFPEHTLSLRALKESGLIFFYLKSGSEQMALLNKITATHKISEDASGIEKLAALKVKADKESEAINKAQEFFEKASALDPFYVESLDITKNLESLKTVKGNILSKELCYWYDDVYDYVETKAVPAVNTFAKAIEDWDRSPYEGSNSAWSLVEDSVKSTKEVSTGYTTRLLGLVNITKDYKTEDNQELLTLTRELIRDLDLLTEQLLNTKGNSLTGWKASFREAQAKYNQSNADYTAALGNETRGQENFLNAVKALTSFELFEEPEQTEGILENRKEIIREL